MLVMRTNWKQLLGMVAALGVCSAEAALEPDLFIGTQGVGNVTPAAAYPFGLVQAGPDLSKSSDAFVVDNWHFSGYQHDSPWIWRFSQTHLSGAGCPSLGDFGIMPFGGEWDPESRAFPLVKEEERAEPGYYAVGVSNGLGVTTCEMTALEHTAVYRFRFGAAAHDVRFLVDLDWGIGTMDRTDCFGKFVTKCHFKCPTDPDGVITGGRRCWSWADYEYHFALRLSVPIRGVETLREPDGRRGGIYVLKLGDVPGGELVVRIALSNTSPENADRNLMAEAPCADFDAARKASAQAWSRRLGLVELDPKTPARVRANFAAALYHVFVQPNRQSDVGTRPVYSTFSLWDTFRAAHPLYTVLCPKEDARFVESMLDQCDRQGYLPIWALGGSENHCMIGHHAVPVVVDACLKGLLPSNQVERAYKAVRQTLTVRHKPVNDGTWGLLKEDWDILDKYGYYPFDQMRGGYGGEKVRGESAARTLECAYDDACAARLAQALGHAEDATFFARRAGNWKNVFDPELRCARGRDSNGRWREPFDRYECGSGPWNDNDFCEGGSCQYSWHVPHDPEGLVAFLGGREQAGKRLDGLFSDRPPNAGDKGYTIHAITGCIGQYVHGNEISHHIAYLYAYTDRPWRAGEIVGRICATQYNPRPDGLCGNDDCGQMSAWYVFSALGFYPMDPCGGEYVIGAPQVPGAVVRLGNGKLLEVVVRGPLSAGGRVRSVSFNGRAVTDWRIRHADLMSGGRLEFEMADRP